MSQSGLSRPGGLWSARRVCVWHRCVPVLRGRARGPCVVRCSRTWGEGPDRGLRRPELEPVFESDDPAEIQIARSILDGAGIPTVTTNDSASDRVLPGFDPFRFMRGARGGGVLGAGRFCRRGPGAAHRGRSRRRRRRHLSLTGPLKSGLHWADSSHRKRGPGSPIPEFPDGMNDVEVRRSLSCRRWGARHEGRAAAGFRSRGHLDRRCGRTRGLASVPGLDRCRNRMVGRGDPRGHLRVRGRAQSGL